MICICRQYRQDVVFGMGADLTKELDFINEMAENQAKNYQIWYMHKRECNKQCCAYRSILGIIDK